MMLGLNTATIPTVNLQEAIEVAVSAGFSGIEPRVAQLRKWQGKPIKKRSLEWLPLNSLEGLFARSWKDLRSNAENLFSLAAKFGIPGVIVVCGRGTFPGTNEGIKIFFQLKKLANSYGVKLLYEYLGFPGSALSDFKEAVNLARRAGIPLVLDTFHLAIARVNPQDLLRIPGRIIHLVHLSDATVHGKALEELRDKDRVLPGEGELPLTELLGFIRRTGFNGPISVEVFHPKYRKMDPYLVAKEAFERTNRLLQEVRW